MLQRRIDEILSGDYKYTSVSSAKSCWILWSRSWSLVIYTTSNSVPIHLLVWRIQAILNVKWCNVETNGTKKHITVLDETTTAFDLRDRTCVDGTEVNTLIRQKAPVRWRDIIRIRAVAMVTSWQRDVLTDLRWCSVVGEMPSCSSACRYNCRGKHRRRFPAGIRWNISFRRWADRRFRPSRRFWRDSPGSDTLYIRVRLLLATQSE